MREILWTVVTIAVALLAFGSFGWLGFALAFIAVGIWWMTIGDEP